VPESIDAVIDPERLQVILVDEGIARPNAQWLSEAYRGWTKGKCLMQFGLTQSYQHVGEIAAIGSVMGLNMYDF
jgi:hypothetical protein